jgi:hypothetical protein
VLLGSVKTGAMMIQMQMIFILVKVVWQRTRQTLIPKVKIVTVNRHAPQASKGARVSHLLRVSIPKVSSYSNINISFASFVLCACYIDLFGCFIHNLRCIVVCWFLSLLKASGQLYPVQPTNKDANKELECKQYSKTK